MATSSEVYSVNVSDLEEIEELLAKSDVDIEIELLDLSSQEKHVCQVCEKVCKTAGGLTLHQRRKHIVDFSPMEEDKQLITPNELNGLLVHACNALCIENLYPDSFITQFRNFKVDVRYSSNFLPKIQEIIKMNPVKNRDKFYVEFYNDIVWKASEYFGLEQSAAAVLCRKFGEVLISYLKKQTENSNIESEIKIRSLDQKEFSSMQYLSGYVLHKLFQKYRNDKKYKSETNQQAMAFLLACKCTTEGETNTKLIDALSRGGLWRVSKNIEVIFMICEKYFSIKSDLLSRKINISSLVKDVMEFKPVSNAVKEILQSCEIKIPGEITKVLLYNMLTIYMRVRAFSMARDFSQKDKMAKKDKGKVNALRTSLKKSEEATIEM